MLETEPAEPRLRLLQRFEKGILKEVLSICERNNLTYYASGGTFLGAVRHQGFIPWDDDIDIALPRSDYNILVGLLEAELSDPFTFENYQSADDYHFLWTQVRDPRLLVRIDERVKRPIQACWIDVFPLDGAPRPGFKRWVWKRKLEFFELMWGLSRVDEAAIEAAGRSRGKAITMKLGRALRTSSLLDREKWTRRRDLALQEYELDPNGFCLNAVGAYKFKSIFKFRRVYGEGRDYQFEGLTLNAPENFHEYLSQIYGNYMELPPANNRTAHGAEVHAKKQYAVGYTQGTFDMFHVGHLRLLEHAKQQCDYLIVGVNSDALVENYKGKQTVINDQARMEILKSLSVVDEVRIVDTLDKVAMLEAVPFQAIFIGSDWKGSARWAETETVLGELGVEVVFLEYTEGVTSTLLRTSASQRVTE